MTLFWKIYLASLALVVLAAAMLTGAISYHEAKYSMAGLRGEQQLLATMAASQVDTGYHEQIWPFELLQAISKGPSFTAWQVVDGAGNVVLGDCPPTPGSNQDNRPAVSGLGLITKPQLIAGPIAGSEMWVIPLRAQTGTVPWTFRLAFHSRLVHEHVVHLIITNIYYALAVPILLFPLSLVITRGLVGRLKLLTRAIQAMENGNLSVSLPAGGRNEVDRVIGAFSKMTASLRASYSDLRTSNDLLKQEVAERTKAEAELARHRDHLEQLVAERTADLTVANEQLAVDIERRQAVERTLRDNEESYRVLFESANDAIVILKDNCVCHCNPKALQLFRCTMEQILGKNPIDFSPPAQPDGQDSALKAAGLVRRATAGEPQCFEWVHRLPDGTTFEAEVSLIQVKASGQTFLQGIIRDITERKKAQARSEELNRQLVETSRRVGQAEIATGVLHNVGNVLNSVNVSAAMIQEQLAKSRVSNFAKAAGLLDEHAQDLGHFLTHDARGQQLPKYFGMLAEFLVQEQKTIIQEASSLAKNIEHIKEIVAMQQSYAKSAGISQQVTPSELVEDALQMHAAGLARHRVAVERDFADLPVMTTDKHKVLQVLVNLISNAKYAVSAAPRTDKRVVARTRWASERKDRILIEVCDNGIGIPPENLARVFNHGFTTRPGGHGFGLHSGALAAQQLGGQLFVRSDGPGAGATFTLELPLESPTNEPAVAHKPQDTAGRHA